MKFVIRDPEITVNEVDLSTHVSSVTIEQTSDEVDVTGFKAKAKEILAGIPDATITLNFWQDFDAGSVDATLQPVYDSAEPTEVVVKPTEAAVSATNPSYTMQGVLLNYSPLAGAIGEASATEVAFRNGDQSGIVKAIA
jgi:hypothetical protein